MYTFYILFEAALCVRQMDDGQIEAGVYGNIEDDNGQATEPHHGKSLLFCLVLH